MNHINYDYPSELAKKLAEEYYQSGKGKTSKYKDYEHNQLCTPPRIKK